MIQIFLSYAKKDIKKVKELYQKLSLAGFKPWMDDHDILPGENWDTKIQGAIQDSAFILVCLTRHSVRKRGYFQKEMRFALEVHKEMLDEDIHLIPVRMEECQVPEKLQEKQWVNLYRNDGWERLLDAIDAGIRLRGKYLPIIEEEKPDDNPLGIEKPLDSIKTLKTGNELVWSKNSSSYLYSSSHEHYSYFDIERILMDPKAVKFVVNSMIAEINLASSRIGDANTIISISGLSSSMGSTLLAGLLAEKTNMAYSILRESVLDSEIKFVSMGNISSCDKAIIVADIMNGSVTVEKGVRFLREQLDLDQDVYPVVSFLCSDKNNFHELAKNKIEIFSAFEFEDLDYIMASVEKFKLGNSHDY